MDSAHFSSTFKSQRKAQKTQFVPVIGLHNSVKMPPFLRALPTEYKYVSVEFFSEGHMDANFSVVPFEHCGTGQLAYFNCQ